jgi:hypothetical protein
MKPMNKENRKKYLTRQASIDILYDLASSEFFSEELSDNLHEIANLISYELDGEHFWGQPYESSDKLRVAYREDLWTEELAKEVAEQHERARFTPAPNEVQQLKDYFFEMRGIDEDSDYTDKQQCEKDFAYNYNINNIH